MARAHLHHFGVVCETSSKMGGEPNAAFRYWFEAKHTVATVEDRGDASADARVLVSAKVQCPGGSTGSCTVEQTVASCEAKGVGGRGRACACHGVFKPLGARKQRHDNLAHLRSAMRNMRRVTWAKAAARAHQSRVAVRRLLPRWKARVRTATTTRWPHRTRRTAADLQNDHVAAHAFQRLPGTDAHAGGKGRG